MDSDALIEKAIEEIQKKEFGTTEQILQIHSIVFEDGRPLVLKVEVNSNEQTAVVYFKIENERFYLAVYLGYQPEITVLAVDTYAHHSVYFSATSDDLDFAEMCSMTSLPVSGGWSRGTRRDFGNSKYPFSKLRIEPDPGPGDFEAKITRLLDLLESDRKGVTRMVNDWDGYIQVATVFHNGNTMLGGHHLSKATIQRMAALGLGIDFDEYAEGKFYLD